MPVISVSLDHFRTCLGKDIDEDGLRDVIPRMGGTVEDVRGDEVRIEFDPDRPDILSAEGLARAMRAFLGIQPGCPTYSVGDGDIVVSADASVDPVRPVIVCGVARDVPMTEEALQSLMGLQEDLHWGPGARRRKVSIGVHDMADVEPPFTYRAADPDSVSFFPLQGDREMTMRQIVEEHPKGIDYAHIVQDHDAWPLIEDVNGEVLSFPPIINGTATQLTAESRTLFLDVTGTDEAACMGVLDLLATHLAEMGATLETVTVEYPDRAVVAPDLSPAQHGLRTSYANRLLGTDLSDEDVVAALGRMAMDAVPDGDGLQVNVPAYRLDILHEVDLVEDVAIGHGYDNVGDQLPGAVIFGSAMPSEVYWDRARRIMVGLGYLEAFSLSLVGADVVARCTRTGADAAFPDAMQVQNAASIEHDRIRTTLLPSLLSLAEHNVHRDLPQRYFEVGDVVLPPGEDGRPRNQRRIAGLVVASDASFTTIKRAAEALLRELGLTWRETAADHGTFVPGRCAEVTDTEGRTLGHYGEVHPEVITNFGIANPVAAFEFALGQRPDLDVWTPAQDPMA